MSSSSKHVVIIGIVALLILINLELVLRRLFDHSGMSDLMLMPQEALRNKEQEWSMHRIRTLNDTVMNLTTPTSDPVSSFNTSFMDQQEAIQRTRRAQVSDTCAKNNLGGTFANLMKSPLHRIIVDEKYKLLYCSIPKIASTSWKRVLLVLKGVMKNTNDLAQSEVNNKVAPKKLKFLQFYSEKDIKRMLRDYTKFLVVRDPFSRILSAFRNKLAPKSTFRSCEHWQRGIGMRILNKYKPHSPKAPSRPVFKRLSTPKGVVRYDLTLADFVKFLVNPSEKNDNEHWSEIHKMCSPCLIHYDIISKFETLEVDAEYILRLVHADSVVHFPSSSGSSPTNSSNLAAIKSYFKDVSQKDLKKLSRRFNLDFELFGYEKPEIALS